MSWKIKRKDKAIRNALIRVKNKPDNISLCLLKKRMHEANEYLLKLKTKQKSGWFKWVKNIQKVLNIQNMFLMNMEIKNLQLMNAWKF